MTPDATIVVIALAAVSIMLGVAASIVVTGRRRRRGTIDPVEAMTVMIAHALELGTSITAGAADIIARGAIAAHATDTITYESATSIVDDAFETANQAVLARVESEVSS